MNSRQILADIKEKSANQGEDLRGGISRVFLSLSNKWKPCDEAINSQPHNLKTALKSSYNITEIVNNYGLKRETACQIVGIISQFSQKLYIQFWKYFHCRVLGSAGRGYCKKSKVSQYLARLPERL